MENRETILNMLPVCECGTPIDIDVDMDITKHESGYRYLSIHFCPAICPNCSAKITSVHMDNKYVEMFMRGVK